MEFLKAALYVIAIVLWFALLVVAAIVFAVACAIGLMLAASWGLHITEGLWP